ncbi:MAG: signal recognition particle-docking protein FtsY [Oceanobacter sp.]
MFDFFKRKKKADPAAAKEEAPQDDLQQAESEDKAEALSEHLDAELTEQQDAELVQASESASDELAEEVEEEKSAEPSSSAVEQASEEVVEQAPEAVVDQVEDEPSDEAAVEDILKGGDLAALEEAKDVEQEKPKSQGFFARIRAGLSRTRTGLTGGLANLLLGKKVIDDDLLEDLETSLIMADVGVDATNQIMARLTERVSRKELKDSDALYAALIEELKESLQSVQQPLIPESSDGPFVILMVGINGVGKTTTIGKLAHQFMANGKSVMLAAGDTFRAAAVEQLQVWGERNQVPVVAQHTGADSASVIFDAVQAAKSRGVDVLIADTAGRLHNKDNLMQELEKVVRVMKKIEPNAPHEVMLVLDAGTGQNAINQTKQFLQAVGVSGLTLTKLDGTAKGGVIFALASQFGIPVRYIGVGEGIEDLRPFVAEEFIDALFDRAD